MATQRSKRYNKAAAVIEKKEPVAIAEAVATIKKYPPVKFDESVELNFQLGIDVKQSTQSVRGAVSLPHGTGKAVRVLVFSRGEEARQAEEAGADYVGAEDLVAKVAGGWMDFDVVVAHPNIMKDISKLGKVLGPRGLMPSPKVGTVTQDIAKAVKEVKKGKIEFKSDKTGGLHVACGKLSFSAEQLIENIKTVIKTIVDNKPTSAKGVYLKSVYLSTTMGPGIAIDASAFMK